MSELLNLPATVTLAVVVVVIVLAITTVFCVALLRALPPDVPRIIEPFSQLCTAIVNWMTVRHVYSKGMSRMRHPSRAQVLVEFLDIDLSRYVQANAVFGIKFETVNCPTHGEKTVVQDSRRCRGCPCEIAYLQFNTTPGRRRRYCSPACRQSAYRRRKKAKTAASLAESAANSNSDTKEPAA